MKALVLVAIFVVGVNSGALAPGVDPRCQYIPSDIKYLFYSLRNPETPIIVPSDKTDEIKRTHFDASKETIFMVHGGGGNTSGPLVQKVRAAIVKVKLDVNIIGVDWLGFQNRNQKISVYTCADLFGILVAKFLTALSKTHGLKYNKMTMVGHSIAGRFMTNIGAQLNGEIRSIVGLETCAISKKDAQFVECIYTGRADGLPHGHANFYPNGGTNQSHCPPPPDWACNHWRVVDFYAESITTNKFVAHQCDNYTDFKAGKCKRNPTGIMGQLVPDLKASGKYYLDTNPDPPYAKG